MCPPLSLVIITKRPGDSHRFLKGASGVVYALVDGFHDRNRGAGACWSGPRGCCCSSLCFFLKRVPGTCIAISEEGPRNMVVVVVAFLRRPQGVAFLGVKDAPGAV